MNNDGIASLIKGVAKDRQISVEDAEMRHGRKSRSVRVDGYKRHVLYDLDTGLIRGVGIAPATTPDASVTEASSADLERQQVTLKELHIDRAYLSSHLVRERSDELEVYCKAWPVREGKRFRKQMLRICSSCAAALSFTIYMSWLVSSKKLLRFTRLVMSRPKL